jgi:hypothetical protein
VTIAAVTPAGIPPVELLADDVTGRSLVVGADAGAGVVDVELEPLEHAPIAAAVATSRAGRAKEL